MTVELTKYCSTKGYIYKSLLLERGWTNGAIDKFLGAPDAIKANPHGKNSPPMKLWQESRVLEAEQSEAFQTWLEKSQVRRQKASERMIARAEQIRQNTIALFTERIQSSVNEALQEYQSVGNLEADAIEHWYEYQSIRRSERMINNPNLYLEPIKRPKRHEVDSDTVRRWIENYVRHQLTHYESLLYELKGQIGKQEAYEAMKNIVSQEVEAFIKCSKS